MVIAKKITKRGLSGHQGTKYIEIKSFLYSKYQELEMVSAKANNKFLVVYGLLTITNISKKSKMTLKEASRKEYTVKTLVSFPNFF